MKKIFLLFLVIVGLCAGFVFAQAVSIDIKMLGPYNPAISRFIGFSGVIPSGSAKEVYRSSLRVFINGANETLYLQTEKDRKTGDIYLNYTPVYPLPSGKVEIKIEGVTVDNKNFSYVQNIKVVPESDKILAPYVRAIKANYRDWSAHLELARAYESKYLLKDAMYEYSQVLKYNKNCAAAKENYLRIFSLQERKYITKDKITLDILKDSGIEVLGNLVIFRITLINKNSNTISIDPKQALLVVDEEDQIRPVENLSSYPINAYQNDLITVENYARLRHFLDTHSYSLIGEQDIQPGITVKGDLPFPLKYPHYRKLMFIFPVKVEKKYKLLFKLPFTAP